MSAQPKIPHLYKTANSSQLIVQGKPHLILGDELQNSSLSSAEYVKSVWSNMRAMNFNTLLGSVTWEMIERTEGTFDFSELDKWDIRLVLLWFGNWKNAMSTYVPAWVKKDLKRFPRVQIRDGRGSEKLKTIDLLSPFNRESWEADARAFAALMRHLKEFDGEHSTVIMMQVENETGLLGDSSDRSYLANELFKKAVPEDLIKTLRLSKCHPDFEQRFPQIESASSMATWEEVFGQGTVADEALWRMPSRGIPKVAAAGKAEYPIPHYANASLNFDPKTADMEGVAFPGETEGAVGVGLNAALVPSGGPCPNYMDIWKANAPTLDFVAPDIYLHDYEWECERYRFDDQPLFIPEQRRDEKGARRVMLAYGTYGALGCCPFGIDTLKAEVSPLTKVYGLLKSVSALILEVQATRPHDVMGFFFDEAGVKKGKKSWSRIFGNFEAIVERSFVFGKPGPGSGMVIHQGAGRFLLIGWGFQVSFRSTNSASAFTGILTFEEKMIDSTGNLRTARFLNGDERQNSQVCIMPNDEPDYGSFPIAVTVPARTYIAECIAYSV